MTAPTTGEREPDEISAALNDLEHAVKCEYAFPNVHQAMQRKFDRDMSVVTDARNAYDALRADLARVTALLATAQREAAGLREALTHEDIKLAWVTQGHPEFGIECTICIGDECETLTNQSDPITALINTSKAVRAKFTPSPEAGR